MQHYLSYNQSGLIIPHIIMMADTFKKNRPVYCFGTALIVIPV